MRLILPQNQKREASVKKYTPLFMLSKLYIFDLFIKGGNIMIKKTKNIFLFQQVICIFILLISSSIWSSTFAATFNSNNGELFLPAVFDGEKTYTDVILKLNADSTYQLLEGTESALPFRCESNFNNSTLDLISDGMSIPDIDSLLGCKASQFFNQSDISSQVYSWIDKQCSQLDSIFLNGNLESKSIRYTSNCAFFPAEVSVYDMTRDRFFIQSVIVDEVLVAPLTIVKFDVSNKTWQLISAEIIDRGQPPHLCNLFTKDIFNNKILTANSLAEVEDELGCQWSTKGGDNGFIGFTFLDHECSSIGVLRNDLTQELISKNLILKKSGCGF